MNIAVIKESLCLGGTERSASNISRALAEKYHVYTVLFNEKVIQYPYGGTLIGLSLPPRNGKLKKIWNSVVRSMRIRQTIRKKQIHVAFVFTAVSGLLLHEKFFKCKKIISCRDFGRLQRKPESYAHAVKYSDAIIFNSVYQKDYFVDRYPQYAKKSFVSYNIVDRAMIQEQGKKPVEETFSEFQKEHSVTVVSTGRFCKEKGFEYLIESFYLAHKNQPTLGLVLVGDGELRALYEEKIESYGLKRHIYFTGFQKNPYKYMEKCSMYVLSSISEGFPNVLPEAMACGLPVISVNCLTGPAEILDCNGNYNLAKEHYEICTYGILSPAFVEGQDNTAAEKELAAAIEYLSEDSGLASRMKEKSCKRVKDFSKEAALTELQNVIEFVMGEPT